MWDLVALCFFLFVFTPCFFLFFLFFLVLVFLFLFFLSVLLWWALLWWLYLVMGRGFGASEGGEERRVKGEEGGGRFG